MLSNRSSHISPFYVMEVMEKAAEMEQKGINVIHLEVGITPGTDFGENGEGFIRFSYANSIENIGEGMNRLEKYINKSGHKKAFCSF